MTEEREKLKRVAARMDVISLTLLLAAADIDLEKVLAPEPVKNLMEDAAGSIQELLDEEDMRI